MFGSKQNIKLGVRIPIVANEGSNSLPTIIKEGLAKETLGSLTCGGLSSFNSSEALPVFDELPKTFLKLISDSPKPSPSPIPGPLATVLLMIAGVFSLQGDEPVTEEGFCAEGVLSLELFQKISESTILPKEKNPENKKNVWIPPALLSKPWLAKLYLDAVEGKNYGLMYEVIRLAKVFEEEQPPILDVFAYKTGLNIINGTADKGSGNEKTQPVDNLKVTSAGGAEGVNVVDQAANETSKVVSKEEGIGKFFDFLEPSHQIVAIDAYLKVTEILSGAKVLPKIAYFDWDDTLFSRSSVTFYNVSLVSQR